MIPDPSFPDFTRARVLVAGDLMLDPSWADGLDNEGNFYTDDFIGIDSAYGDVDPWDGHSHGTHCSGTIGAGIPPNFG